MKLPDMIVCKLFQSTRLMRGVTGITHRICPLCSFQSTRLMRGVTKRHFSTHIFPTHFQSTRLMRGVTCLSVAASVLSFLISIHTPHARRDIWRKNHADTKNISIHTPHARRDFFRWVETKPCCYFNPHASCEA